MFLYWYIQAPVGEVLPGPHFMTLKKSLPLGIYKTKQEAETKLQKLQKLHGFVYLLICSSYDSSFKGFYCVPDDFRMVDHVTFDNIEIPLEVLNGKFMLETKDKNSHANYMLDIEHAFITKR